MKVTMKIFLKIAGVVVLLIVVGVGLFIYQGSKLDRESKQYVDESVPLILTDWNEEALLSRVTPNLQSKESRADLDKLFNMFMRLGRLIDVREPQGQALMSYTTQQGRR